MGFHVGPLHVASTQTLHHSVQLYQILFVIHRFLLGVPPAFPLPVGDPLSHGLDDVLAARLHLHLLLAGTQSLGEGPGGGLDLGHVVSLFVPGNSLGQVQLVLLSPPDSDTSPGSISTIVWTYSTSVNLSKPIIDNEVQLVSFSLDSLDPPGPGGCLGVW